MTGSGIPRSLGWPRSVLRSYGNSPGSETLGLSVSQLTSERLWHRQRLTERQAESLAVSDLEGVIAPLLQPSVNLGRVSE